MPEKKGSYVDETLFGNSNKRTSQQQTSKLSNSEVKKIKSNSEAVIISASDLSKIKVHQ